MSKLQKAGRKKGGYSQTARVLALLDRLEQARVAIPVAALAAELGITERQLRRDFGALEEAGYELEPSLVEGRAAVELQTKKRATVALGVGERVALVAAREVFRAFEGTDLAHDVANAVGKVADTLLPKHRKLRSIEQLEPRIAYVPDGGIKPLEDPDGVLDAILSALLHGQAVEAVYVGASGRPRRGILEPYGIALYRHALYVVGRWQRESTVRVHAVERFESAERRRDLEVQVPPGFDVREFFSGAFGVWTTDAPTKVVVDFSPGAAHVLASRRYHRSQTVEKLPSGAVRVGFELGITPDLVTWLVGWGDAAFVREPVELRERVLAAHRAACETPSWVR